MNEQVTRCDHERLRLLLANELAEEMEKAVVRHLADCLECRNSLESLAGDANWWTELHHCLSRNAESLAVEQESALADIGDASFEPAAGDFCPSEFAVDFLQPCEQPGALGKIDEIEILEVIGHGGMGVVLKGFQRELGRYVAVKMMAPHLAANGSARKRFAREARATAAIVHPHVMAIHTVNATGRLPYLIMPFVDCESLQQRLDREGMLATEEILRISHQVADGLDAAHSQGLVHRDVKPANILLERGVDRVMLTDLGLARTVDDANLTQTGVIAGTPHFMSPEQARGDSVDQRSDLFSLGSVLYTACTGRPPFRAETSYGVLRRITDDEPRRIREVNPGIPDWLESVIAKLMAKQPGDRYESARQVAELLERCLAHVQQPTLAPLPPECARNSTRRPSAFLYKPIGVITMTATLLLAFVGFFFLAGPFDDGADRKTPTLQSAKNSATANKKTGRVVSGRLLKEGKPLAGISIAMSQVDKSSPSWTGKEYVTKTDKSGRFEFSDVAVTDEVFVYGMMRDLRALGSSPVRKCKINGDGLMTSVGDLQIEPAHSITGRVACSDGKPLPKGTTLTFQRISTRTWLSPLDKQRIELAPDGAFRVEGLPRALLDVSLRVKGYRLSEQNASFDRLNGFSLNGIVKSDISGLNILLEPGKRRSVNPRTMSREQSRKFRQEELEKKRRPLRGVERLPK